jgi:hypothetical protein
MKWLMTILAMLVGVLLIATLKLAGVKHVDTSPEVLREMAELRDAWVRCEATKRQADADAPASLPAPAREPIFENISRPNESPKQKCMLEAERLGKPAALWCAGL